MINKKRVWFGLVASLALAPLLVATATLPQGAAAEPQTPALQPPVGFDPVPGGPLNRGVNGGTLGQTEPLNAPPASRPAPPTRLEPIDRNPMLPRTLPAQPTPLEGNGPGVSDSSQPDKFSVSPLKTTPFVTTAQPGEPKQPSTAPGTTPGAAPQAAPDAAAPFSIVEGLPKLGGAAPASQANTNAPSASPNVSGQTATNPGNVGDLLSKSNSALGVEVQKRSPVVGDPRVQGLHFGQLVTHADGAYYFPARVDLDSVVSKINAADIENILIVKGPFSVRYGAGFSFLDIQSLRTPRYTDGCFEAHGSTSLNYRTNGQGWSGQQSFWGGNADWGFRISYDIQSAIDYTTGNGARLPSGYNNHVANIAFGFNLTPDSAIELKYLHAQQSNVIFPGLLTNINNLETDGFAGRYTATKGSWYDRFTLDAWVNNTRFNGDSSNPGTRRQIQQLDDIFARDVPRPGDNAVLADNFLPVRLDLTTNGSALSYGAREITTWGDVKGFNLSLGADIRVFSSNYNEFNAFNLSVLQGTNQPGNFGIPFATQVDPGLLLDVSIPVGERWNFKAGTRVDFVTTYFDKFGPNTDVAVYRATVGDPTGQKDHFLFAGFITGEYKITDHWTAQGGYGYAERAPTITELYTGGAFLGLIQNGFNSITGDPQLRKEVMHHLNIGLNADYERFRAGVYGFYAFVPDYITYRVNQQSEFFSVDIATGGGRNAAGVLLPPVITGTTPIRNLRFANTSSATIFGFDAYTEVDATPWLTPFFTLNYSQGWDHVIDEALPGFSPVSSKVGMRFHEEGKNPKWGVEYYARLVANQDLFARSLGEQRTAGFVTHNIRAYWQARERMLILGGIENIGDLHYREHLDLRTGTPVGGGPGGVFQPGINFYVGMKLTY